MKQENIPHMLSNIDEFYMNFRNKLDENHTFPSNYTFKFILENNSEFLTRIYHIFNNMNNDFSVKESSNRKYISCTIVSFVLDADQVIRLYKKVSGIKGIIML